MSTVGHHWSQEGFLELGILPDVGLRVDVLRVYKTATPELIRSNMCVDPFLQPQLDLMLSGDWVFRTTYNSEDSELSDLTKAGFLLWVSRQNVDTKTEAAMQLLAFWKNGKEGYRILDQPFVADTGTWQADVMARTLYVCRPSKLY